MFRRVQVPRTRSQKNTRRFPCNCNSLAHSHIQPVNANFKIGASGNPRESKFKLQIEGKEAMQQNHAFSTKQLVIRCVSQNRFPIANCSPEPGVLCELSTHTAHSSIRKLHEQTPPPMANGFLRALCDLGLLPSAPNCTNKLRQTVSPNWDCFALSPNPHIPGDFLTACHPSPFRTTPVLR